MFCIKECLTSTTNVKFSFYKCVINQMKGRMHKKWFTQEPSTTTKWSRLLNHSEKWKVVQVWSLCFVAVLVDNLFFCRWSGECGIWCWNRCFSTSQKQRLKLQLAFVASSCDSLPNKDFMLNIHQEIKKNPSAFTIVTSVSNIFFPWQFVTFCCFWFQFFNATKLFRRFNCLLDNFGGFGKTQKMQKESSESFFSGFRLHWHLTQAVLKFTNSPRKRQPKLFLDCCSWSAQWSSLGSTQAV